VSELFSAAERLPFLARLRGGRAEASGNGASWCLSRGSCFSDSVETSVALDAPEKREKALFTNNGKAALRRRACGLDRRDGDGEHGERAGGISVCADVGLRGASEGNLVPFGCTGETGTETKLTVTTESTSIASGADLHAETFASERVQVGRDFACITLGLVRTSSGGAGLLFVRRGIRLELDD